MSVIGRPSRESAQTKQQPHTLVQTCILWSNLLTAT